MEEEKLKSYCVTGGSGFIGSWLVRSLLQMGCKVHATVRRLEKSSHLLKLPGASERLRLFKADLREEGSFDEAVRGCSGLFHVAAPMEFGVQATQNTASYVQQNVLEPAIQGTFNVLKSCLKSNSVKRVVFTSSISTMTARDSYGNWTPLVDESCKIPVQHVNHTKPSGWIYVLVKVLTEEAAFQFAKDNGIDFVSIITPTVAGPFLTPTVPSSIQVLLSPITGDPELLAILTAVNSRMGSIALAHVEDICSAHIFLMENTKAEGRYMCCARSWAMSEVIDHLTRQYPSPALDRPARGGHDSEIPSEISSKKLRDLGFSFKYDIDNIIRDTISSCTDHGFLPSTQKGTGSPPVHHPSSSGTETGSVGAHLGVYVQLLKGLYRELQSMLRSATYRVSHIHLFYHVYFILLTYVVLVLYSLVLGI